MTPAPETHALALFGALHDGPDTLLLLGPNEPGFWAHFTAQPEYSDGLPDPLDRWSKRVITSLAQAWDGTAIFPSDGPPYPAFLDWALRSKQAFTSPVGMLVHARAGLMVSYRGAVRLPGHRALPAPAAPPAPPAQPRPAARPALSMPSGQTAMTCPPAVAISRRPRGRIA
ncbi:ferredoxin [Rhodobacteraceae bacterium D3-12]|nr:ferredoxin [Rhodobacteraceae bacterium D3-12]